MPLVVNCPELSGNLLFTLQSSLIIHRHSLSFGSPLHFTHNLPFLLHGVLPTRLRCPSYSFLPFVIRNHFPLSNLHLSILSPPSLLCGALLDNGGIPWPDCRKVVRGLAGAGLTDSPVWDWLLGLLSLCQGKWRELREVELWEGGGGEGDQLGCHSCVDVLETSDFSALQGKRMPWTSSRVKSASCPGCACPLA